MGNCLVHHTHKVVKIMKMDGEILEYQTPLKVQQVVSNFIGHAISDGLPVRRHLSLNTEMVSGRMYYLLPPPLPLNKVDENTSTKQENDVVRIKLVISKQQLKDLLTSKGGISVDDMLSQLQIQQCNEDNGDGSCRPWKPALQSIPE